MSGECLPLAFLARNRFQVPFLLVYLQPSRCEAVYRKVVAATRGVCLTSAQRLQVNSGECDNSSGMLLFFFLDPPGAKTLIHLEA